MKKLKLVIKLEEPDKYGRTIKLGLEEGSNTSFFQVISVDELKDIRDKINEFLKNNNYE